MTRLPLLILLLFLLPILAGPTAGSELRGLWVDAYHPGFKTPDETAEMVARAADCGFDTLFVQVRKRGNVYYKSDIEPMAPDAEEGYDALADVLSRARKAGLKVHAWIIVYEVHHDNKWVKTAPNQIHEKRPEWLTRDNRAQTKLPGDVIFLDPGLPEVQDYLVSIVEEIARKYKVDGVHLDGIKYPGASTGYNEKSLARFRRETGAKETPGGEDETWCKWRREQVTAVVRRMHEALAKVRPGIELSAAVLPNIREAVEDKFQDWQGWLKDGILDAAVPMVFTTQADVFEHQSKEITSAAGGKTVYLGQAGFRMDAEAAVGQIESAKALGAQGVVLYSYHTCRVPRSDSKTATMDALKARWSRPGQQ